MNYFRTLTYYKIRYSAYKPGSENNHHSLDLKCWIRFKKEWYLINGSATEVIDMYNCCGSYSEMENLTKELINNNVLKWE